MSWSYGYAFRAGDGHSACDDACVCEVLGDTLIAAVADGAGSAENSRLGAALTCQAFVEMGVAIFDGAIQPSNLLDAISRRIPAGQADTYACTLVGMVAGPKGALILQVGDGACVFRSPATASAASPAMSVLQRVPGSGQPVAEANLPRTHSGYSLALAPEETEFLNHTYFVTAKDAGEHLQVRRIDGPILEVALFTDGLQDLVVDRGTRAPHEPFFNGVFKHLADEPGHDLKTSWWLKQVLASELVTKKTDDDTSIVIARRFTAAKDPGRC